MTSEVTCGQKFIPVKVGATCFLFLTITCGSIDILKSRKIFSYQLDHKLTVHGWVKQETKRGWFGLVYFMVR